MLTKIKLAGFKSFADMTSIPIVQYSVDQTDNRGVIGIAGPNGCGKSNISDAVRWVFGEKSAKSLRGQAMDDVIFNGTAKRKPLGRASVELYFDNTNGRLSKQYEKYAELVVRRDILRHEQSIYYINGTRVRRQDISDMILGTGLGPKSYAVIGQGLISQFIDAKPEELRAHLEEAAGISKYKERRRDTETKINQTQENINRINDLRLELESQSKTLERQREEANRYETLANTERDLLAHIEALRFKKLSQQGITQKALFEEITASLAQQEVICASLEDQKRMMKQKQLLNAQQLETLQDTYHQLATDIARQEEGMKYAQDQKQAWEQERTDSQVVKQRLEDAWTDSTDLRSETLTQCKESKRVLEEKRSALSKQEQSLQQLKTDLKHREALRVSCQEEAARVLRDTQLLETKKSYEQKALDHLMAREKALNQQLDTVKSVALLESVSVAQLKLDTLHASLEEQERTWQHLLKDLKKQTDSHAQIKIRQASLQIDIQALQTEVAGIEALQASALKSSADYHDNDAESPLLRQHAQLGHVLEVNPGWELAVEMVLHDYFDAVCVDSMATHLQEGLQWSGQGCLTLLEGTLADELRTHIPQTCKKRTLAHEVKAPPVIMQWLSRIYVVDDLSEAIALLPDLTTNESVMTPTPCWLGKGWCRVINADHQTDYFLLREKSLNILYHTIREKTDILDQLMQQLTQDERLVVNLTEQKTIQDKEMQALHLEMTRVQTELCAQETQLAQHQEMEHQFVLALSECCEKIAKTKQTLTQFIEDEKGNQARIIEVLKQRDEMKKEKEQYADILASCEQSWDQKKKAVETAQWKVMQLEQQLDGLDQKLSYQQDQILQLDEKLDFLNMQLLSVLDPSQKLMHQLQEQKDKSVALENQLYKKKQQAIGMRKALDELDQQQGEAQMQLSYMRESVTEKRLEQQSITLQQANIEEKMQELGIDLKTVVIDDDEQENIKTLKERYQKISRELKKIGPINLAAAQEYEQLIERKTYLDAQVDDLNKALSLLKHAIETINHESKARFSDIYHRANEKFQDLFPRIFGGGHARLILTDSDPLTSGVAVQAQPAGKRNNSIQMLSGGEKALTTIALIFSLFYLNPAPFCILDEVDSPLDDVNVNRFIQLVKEMSKEVQFLIISHNKSTIEMSDQLIGITMQEPGVSRVVTVSMAEAMSMAEVT